MTALQIVQTLDRILQQENIRYCHWKSNEHVDAAVEGKTDLDVLVDETEKEHLSRVLTQIGFKYFEAIPCRRYVDIDDYLVVDAETGALVHLHLHYRLELGEKHLKGYHLPWEDLILTSRLYDTPHNVYIAEPNIEMILLIVRVVLKVRMRDRLNALLGHDYFDGDFIREYRWLKERIDVPKVEYLSTELMGSASAQLVLQAIESEAQLGQLLKPGNAIEAALRQYRRYHRLVSTVLRWRREVEYLSYRVRRKFFEAPVTTRRTSTQGGLVVAILGADGSGKSTVTSEITRCLSQKLDVFPIYLGSGDGKASLVRLPLVIASRAAQMLRKKRSSASAQPQPTYSESAAPPKSKLSSLVRMLWATTLVYEKEGKVRQSRVARDRGMIVISDRYPQTQVLGFNDGPLLSSSNGQAAKFPRSLQQWELTHYQNMIETMPPDLVIKLNVTPEVALARKSDTPADVVRQKVTAVKDLKFPRQTRVIDIDATQPLDQVLLKAKWAIWENLQ